MSSSLIQAFVPQSDAYNYNYSASNAFLGAPRGGNYLNVHYGSIQTGSLSGQSFTHDFRLSVDLHNPQCELIWAQASSRGRYLSWQELQYQQQLSVMFSLSGKFSKLPFWSTSVPVRFPGWSTRVTSWDINCLRHTCQVYSIGSTNSGDGEFQKESKKTKR